VSTFVASKLLLGDFQDSTGRRNVIVVGAFGNHQLRNGRRGAHPRIHQIFVSTNSRHVKEITNCSSIGGASLNILSGFVAGNMSAFWMGLAIMVLMFASYYFFPKCCFARIHAARICFCHADLRFRSGKHSAFWAWDR